MNCPKCGIYNPYGKQACSQCGHAFVPKPIHLSDDETKAAQERKSQPYFYAAKEQAEKKPDTPLTAALKTAGSKSKSAIEYVSALAAFIFREIRKNKRVWKIILAVLGIICVALIALGVSCTASCISDYQRRLAEEAALAAALAAANADVDTTPSITSMSDVWVLNQYNTKLTLNQDGSFSDENGSGTWTYDEDKIYFVYSDGTLKNRTYLLAGDYLFLDWETMEFTRNCNESEAVEIAGLWISGSGYAMALNEDGTHGAGFEEYGKYANAWAFEDGVLAMVTIRNNVEYFDYYSCEINGDTMMRTSGTVYVRQDGGITLGGGEIEFSSGYDPNA